MANRISSVLTCVAAVCLLFSQDVFAADQIGTVKTLGGTATITRAGEALPAALGMGVLQSDLITTAAGGRIGITFIDNSTMSLGPNASLSLDTFRFDSTTYEGQFQSTLKQGTLAAVSGRIAKQTPEAMTVRTPSAILGVRGTKFVVQAGGG